MIKKFIYRALYWYLKRCGCSNHAQAQDLLSCIKKDFQYRKTIGYRNICKAILVIIVSSIVRSVSRTSAHFYNYPSQKLNVVGVTGTNGKTTITYMIEHILNKAGCVAGVVGTISYGYSNQEIPYFGYTTPPSLYIQRIMNTMVKEHVTHFVMEVSSQCIELERVNDIDFDAAIFTHLTQDHLLIEIAQNNYTHQKHYQC